MFVDDVKKWVISNVKRPNRVKIGTHVEPDDDDLCLSIEDTHWEIFYAEKGKKYLRQIFNSEVEACSAFVDWVKRTDSLYPLVKK